MRKAILVAVISLLGVLALWTGTDGFRAYTSEGARRFAVAHHPRELPNVTFQDQNGSKFTLSNLKGKYVVFTFFYASCGDVCPALETQFQKVVAGIPDAYKGKDITFLSISFDPARDNAEALQYVAKTYQADNVTWKIVTIPDKNELKDLLATCDVVVIPDNEGGFEHNAAIYAADRQLRLTQIFDYNTIQPVINKVMSYLKA